LRDAEVVMLAAREAIDRQLGQTAGRPEAKAGKGIDDDCWPSGVE
jgi:hypothetical protein